MVQGCFSHHAGGLLSFMQGRAGQGRARVLSHAHAHLFAPPILHCPSTAECASGSRLPSSCKTCTSAVLRPSAPPPCVALCRFLIDERCHERDERWRERIENTRPLSLTRRGQFVCCGHCLRIMVLNALQRCPNWNEDSDVILAQRRWD